MDNLELMMCNINKLEENEPIRGLFTNGESFMDNGNVIVYYDDEEKVKQILNYDNELAKEIIRLYKEW